MDFWHILRDGWKSVLDLFYPPLCMQCRERLEESELFLCADCLEHLPRTEMASNRGNRVEQLFWDIPKFNRGAAFCFYRRSEAFRRMIHRMKYGNKPLIGEYLGELAAREFLPAGFFQGIDLIVPVPLHPKRQRKRGYNQAWYIAMGISKATAIPVDVAHLQRVINNPTQTSKTVQERAGNTHGIFSVQTPADWRGKHILLVDDIITTGSTLRACMKVITPVQGTSVSVMSLGVAGA